MRSCYPISSFLHVEEFNEHEPYFELFNFHKSRILLICSFVTFICISARYLFLGRSHRSILSFLPITLMTVFLAISTFTSSHQYFALWGFPAYYEGGLVYFSYIVLYVASYSTQWNHFRLNKLSFVICISSIIIAVIGFFEFFGFDFFNWSPVRQEILSSLVDEIYPATATLTPSSTLKLTSMTSAKS